MATRLANEFDAMDQQPSTFARKALVVGIAVAVLTVITLTLGASTPPAQQSCPQCPEDCLGSKYIPDSQTDSVYKIKIVSDMDKASKVEGGKYLEWRAIVKTGTLVRHASTAQYSLSWEEEKEYRSMHSYKGRGMELSELIRFDGRLLTFCDNTGIVYDLQEKEAVPWQILGDGNGQHTKGFKAEWATIKGNTLFVGSIGKEWTDPKTAEILSTDPQFIKVISKEGHVTSLDWSEYYNKMRVATGTSDPGYMVHESCNWHERLQRWVFLPRRLSKLAYDDTEDERRAANTMIVADESFQHIRLVNDIGPFSETRGFSSFKFFPNHDTEFVALKSEEDGDHIATYLTVLNMEGQVLMEEVKVGDVKFEGVELMP